MLSLQDLSSEVGGKESTRRAKACDSAESRGQDRHRQQGGLLAGVGRRGGGVWDWQMQSIMCETDKQQSPAAEHRGLYAVP